MIQAGTVVQLCYSLKDSQGTVLDQADRKDPFTYLHGGGQIVPDAEF
jgi:FKBP-type peptidyl-prolyl cis-trans isomerase 2